MTDTRTIRFEGSPPFVSALAQMLRVEGIDVTYDAPQEQRSLSGDVEQVMVILTAMGSYDAMTVVVRRFRERWTKARVEIEGDDDEGEPSPSPAPD